MALRRDEDRRFTQALGLGERWLDLPEAPHRGYDSPEALFAGVRADDEAREAVAGGVRELIAEVEPDLLLGPQALGGHADHVLVLEALRAAEPRAEVRLWSDLPYAMRVPPSDEDRAQLLSPAALERKLEGCAAYTTQLERQFAGEEAMRTKLRAWAEAEGRRIGVDGPAEAWQPLS